MIMILKQRKIFSISFFICYRFSYFYEAFEAYHTNGNKKANKAFKYMLIAKIMNNNVDDVY